MPGETLQDLNTKAENIWEDNHEFRIVGRVRQVEGVIVQSVGPPASMGDLCWILQDNGERIQAEVVGIKDDYLELMPVGELHGISSQSRVLSTGQSFQMNTGEHLLGRVVDGRGKPMDAGPPFTGGVDLPIYRDPPSSLHRQRVTEPLATGVRSIDGCLTLGRGQRIGIFSGSGVGKSTLLGMIARYTDADINVVSLVGERRREVRDFMVKNLDREARQKTVLVVATSDEPPLLRKRCAFIATTIAEYFRDQGKDVMLMMDSVTRVARAQREIGLARGEPPANRAFPPSVFTFLPRLLERSGAGEEGTITGIYSVLVEGDDMNEPISDSVRGILDGHITLTRDLATQNHYPAVDVLESVSRVMVDVTSDEHQAAANQLKEAVSTYRDAEDLINIGAYERGSNSQIDYALDHIEEINDFLQQGIWEATDYEQTVSQLKNIFAGENSEPEETEPQETQ